MRRPTRTFLLPLILAALPWAAALTIAEDEKAAPTKTAAPPKDTAAPPKAIAAPAEETSCIKCHCDPDRLEVWEGEQRRLYIAKASIQQDIHWQKGLSCHDCHGGNIHAFDIKEVPHAKESGFRAVKSPADVPEFCGHCHSSVEYMRRYNPSPRTDQVTEYWTSGHGRQLKATGDPKVATCVSCHGHHGMRAVRDLASPVYPTHVAKTCAVCHSNKEVMAGRQYHGRPLGHHQYEDWEKSVHAEALLKKGDLSAATCNSCHGNHGALPPQVDSVANACGACHGKVAKLFAATSMKHQFEKAGLPGCATCHSNHLIRMPSDEMLGMEGGAVCATCHAKGKYGATLAGANVARQLREKLEDLKTQITEAEAKVAEADRLGMEVRGPRFDLRKAVDAKTNARVLIHSFALQPVNDKLAEGLVAATEVREKAEAALWQFTYRRIWLAATLVPIMLVIVLLLLYIRSMSPSAGGGEREDNPSH